MGIYTQFFLSIGSPLNKKFITGRLLARPMAKASPGQWPRLRLLVEVVVAPGLGSEPSIELYKVENYSRNTG